MSDEEFKLGWAKDTEDWDFLANATARTFSAPANFVAPAKMSFREILTVENQRQMGSCVGHGLSTAQEVLEFYSNGGKIQFSRWFAYRQSQIASGIRGDNGANISAAVKVGMTIGGCYENECPYPNQYNTQGFTQAQLSTAAKHKFLGHIPINSGQEAFDFMAQAKGPIIIGFDVTAAYNALRGSQSRVTPSTLKTRSQGGHCVLLAGYQQADELDQIGSWDVTWGDKGWAPWTLEAVDYMCQQERGQSSVWGVTDIQGFDQERVDRVVAWSEVM